MGWMANRVKISKTPEAVPKCGSYKVEYPGGIEYFYYDDEKSRRLRPDAMTSEQALESAKEFARERSMMKKISCPVCEAEAEDTTPHTFDGDTVKCGFCGEFELTRSVPADERWTSRDRAERLAVLEQAKKKAAVGKRPRIDTYML